VTWFTPPRKNWLATNLHDSIYLDALAAPGPATRGTADALAILAGVVAGQRAAGARVVAQSIALHRKASQKEAANESRGAGSGTN
jgi:hypothetical protein